MIVVVLLLIWVVALTPFVLRRLSEHQIATSVSKFRTATSVVRRVYPRLVSVASEQRVAAAQRSNEGRTSVERHRRELERAQRQIERRRQLLVRLAGGTGTTVVFGAIPHLHVLWTLSIIGGVLTVGYVATLAYLAQQPKPLPTMQRPQAPVRAPLPDDANERIAASGGGGHVFIPQMPRRPAFVIVNPNS